MTDILDENMVRALTDSAFKTAMETIAHLAEDAADDAKNIRGDEALRAFAASIRSTNLKQFGGST